MPTYEYRCTACGEHLEIVQSFRDEPLTTCPACGGVLRKVFGSIGVVFKGTGFYKTDSRPSSGKARDSATTGTGSESPSAGSTKTGSDGAGSEGGDAKASQGTKDTPAPGPASGAQSGSSSAPSKPSKSDKKPDKGSGSKAAAS